MVKGYHCNQQQDVNHSSILTVLPLSSRTCYNRGFIIGIVVCEKGQKYQ